MVVVAIDGPSGAGKSSVARAVASAHGWSYLDTGALYRALTLFALNEEIANPSQIPARIPSDALLWDGNPAQPQIFLMDVCVDQEIRSERVTNRVSEIAADPHVRSLLLEMQRTIINNARAGIVVEGRDIGTTVWPDAELKIFLTADLTARAERRNAELLSTSTSNEVQHSLAARDHIDSHRSASPLRQIEEQIVIDATYLSLEEVVAEVQNLIKKLGLIPGVHND